MIIQLNGEKKGVSATTIAELVTELKLESRMLAVECNLEVVAKSAYETTFLKEDDRIEIVHMIGGG